MKRFLPWIALPAAILITWGISRADDPKAVPPGNQKVITDVIKPTLVAPANAPDPSAVYGYICLVDPATRQIWATTTEDGQIRGYPEWAVRFRQVNGNGVAEIVFQAGQGIGTLYDGSSRQVGLTYYAALVQDRHEAAPRMVDIQGTVPLVARSGFAGSFANRSVIKYNPDLWRYETVTIRNRGSEPWIGAEPRKAPFAQLPNLNVAASRGKR